MSRLSTKARHGVGRKVYVALLSAMWALAAVTAWAITQ